MTPLGSALTYGAFGSVLFYLACGTAAIRRACSARCGNSMSDLRTTGPDPLQSTREISVPVFFSKRHRVSTVTVCHGVSGD